MGNMFRLATNHGIYKDMRGASDLQVVENVTAEQMRMDGVLHKYMAMPEEEWKSLKEPLRSRIKDESWWGGQGHVSCKCKGPCKTDACKCVAKKLKCNSRCHKGNSACVNCYDYGASGSKY